MKKIIIHTSLSDADDLKFIQKILFPSTSWEHHSYNMRYEDKLRNEILSNIK